LQGVLGSADNCGLAREVVDWSQFKAYLLQRMTKRTAEQRMRYAKKYYQILLSNNGDNRNAQQQSLLQIQGDKRIQIMKAISSLARFTAQVPAWHEIKQRYNLKWSTGTEKLDAFQRFFNDDGKSSLNSMLKWVKDALEILPAQMGEAIKWNALTGLRPVESLQAIKLIKDPATFKTYYDTERQCLEHFKFPDLFLRRTMTTYVTIVDNDLLEIAYNSMSNLAMTG
jgi:hypothetical protein